MATQTTRTIFAVLTTFLLGVSIRLGPLWWSPLPATLDGLVYAGHVRRTLAIDHVPFVGFRADAFGSTLLTGVASEVTATDPLLLLQPLYGIIGGTTVFLGFLFARRLGKARNWGRSRIRRAGLLAAIMLAIEGIFVRRTGVPDDDTLTLLLIPLTAFALYQFLNSNQVRWVGVALPLLAVFPVMHTFSSLMLGLTLIGVVSISVSRDGLARQQIIGIGLVAGFWGATLSYYTLAPNIGLVVPYVGRVSGNPGLFTAWLIVLIVGVVWFPTASTRVRRLAVGTPLALFFIIVAVNSRVAVFPGTAQTPQVVLLFTLPLALPGMLAVWESGTPSAVQSVGVVLLALTVAPITQVLFSLSASLSPEFAATAMRAQTHFHLPIAILAGSYIARLAHRSLSTGPRWKRGFTTIVAAAFVVAIGLTAPVAFVNLDTGSVPSTTLESELAAGAFTAEYLTQPWTTSHTQARITKAPRSEFEYAGGVGATRQWLRGGPPPSCAVILQQSWTTTGAHLFPAAPETLSTNDYQRWMATNHVVYQSTGHDPLAITVPPETGGSDC